MVGAETPFQPVPAIGPGALAPTRPPPAQRVVEGAAQATLRHAQTESMIAAPPSSAERLAASARQFAEVLDSTGSVQVASSVSGFQVGRLDTYA